MKNCLPVKSAVSISTLLKWLVPVLLLVWPVTAKAAAPDSTRFWFAVYGADRNKTITEGIKGTLLTADSAFMDSLTFFEADRGGPLMTFVNGFYPQGKGDFIIRLEHPDYATLYVPFKVRYIRRSWCNNLPYDVTMPKKNIRPIRETQLNEAVVTATKIKMVVKGDTLVYNADAFQLSKGSMLDALIEQLPGVVLKENGLITVNGRPVSSLLVNGKDFFRGNPAIALENLPSYMVDKVKVYEKESDRDRFVRGDRDRREQGNDSPLVMDVNLKKEYSIGWIANAEGGYGTDERYLGRLFALRFTPHSRLAVFANANNTNDTRRPGRQGDWNPTWQPRGLQSAKTAGIEYAYDNTSTGVEWTSNADVAHTDNTVQNQTTSTSFLPGGQTFGRSESFSDACRTTVSTNHNLKLTKKKALQKLNASFNYDRSRNMSLSRAATFAEDPFAYVSTGLLDSVFSVDNGALLRAITNNRRATEARSDGENYSVSVPYSLTWRPFTFIGDVIDFDAAFNYDSHSGKQFNHYTLDYPAAQGGDTDFRNRYSTSPSRHYSYRGRLRYYTGALGIDLQPGYEFSREYRSGNYDLYRLDRLEGWGEGTAHSPGELPSAHTELQQAIDHANSEHSQLWQDVHHVNLFFQESHFRGKFRYRIYGNLGVKVMPEHLVFARGDVRADKRRTNVFFAPTVHFQHQILHKNDLQTNYYLNYSHTGTPPSFLNTIATTDDVDPLYVSLGNPDLKNTHTDQFYLQVHTGRGFSHLYTLDLFYSVTRNAVAMGQTYNPLTGGYTVRPENVNGNWQAGGTLNLTRQFGRQKRFTLTSETSGTFYHSVDLSGVEGSAASARSTVRTLYAGETLRLDYGATKWRIGTKARANWTNARSARDGFTTVNAWDYDMGLTGRVQLPWDMELSTDFGLYSRRGYEDEGMNTDDLVWNARFSKSILGGNLTFILDGFDILGQLSNVSRTLNAQGRVETWYNSIPRYAMLHVIYRLNREPKKK